MSKRIPELEHLYNKPDESISVVALDVDNYTCVPGVLSNVSEWGARLTADHVTELRKNVGLQVNGSVKLIRATVTGIHKNVASIVFPTEQEGPFIDKRREMRNKVSIPVKVFSRDKSTELEGMIIDASANGCRVQALGIEQLPEEIMLHFNKMEEPVLAEVAWTKSNIAGVRLMWDKPELIG
ncbi:MAG: PilZ domain-containing protein [Rhodobacteraceae bacterium]|nr:PilZ domain-containing protein [Paracoccaceae bacterium]